jgi:hypothetical protein
VRRLRHAADIECESPIFKFLVSIETTPDGRGGKRLDFAGSTNFATHASYELTVEFHNTKDLDIALGLLQLLSGDVVRSAKSFTGEVEPGKPLLRSLKKEARHYGEPDLPFVLP